MTARLVGVPIKRKLAAVTMLTSCLSLLVASAALAVYDHFAFRKMLVENLVKTARMVGENTSAALEFRDVKSAAATLQSLTAHRHVVGAAVYDREGVSFVTYRRKAGLGRFGVPPVEPEGYRIEGSALKLFHPIDLVGERVGTVYIEYDLEELRVRLWRYAGVVSIVILAASLGAFLLSSRLQAHLWEPIAELSRAAGHVAAERDYSVRAVRRGDDEVGRLVDAFNEMLREIETRDDALEEARGNLERRVDERTAELEKTHKELVVASRQGGMAEIATNVLHNVGNVLNSVNVSASVVSDRVRASKAARLARVVALLKQHEGDLPAFFSSDPKAKGLPAYLAQLSEHLTADQEATLGELDLLRRNIDHIKEIVAMQQSYAKVSGLRELVDVQELVEDSLRMNAGALSRHGIRTIRDFGSVPTINVEKHKLLQILVNLVRNAKHACDESGRDDKCLTVRLTNGDGRLRIAIEDNGIGIPAENLTRIFQHGFTTRREGHGFGLHSSGLAAQEMGGSLLAESSGPGGGATFTLELPVSAQVAA